MESYSENNKRIAKNTLLLYARMLLSMAISLYTSRVILKVLGVEDYGIYNIVGGLVSMFSLISSSLSNSVSRFITFELGKNDIDKLKKIFSISVSIHIILAFIIFIAIELIGVWFLNYYMNIADNRIYAANWVIQFSLLTFITNLISVPYSAVIIAHEKMKAFAYVGILEVTLKLLIVYLLVITSIDKLITYSFMLFVVSVLIRSIYGIYCKRFEECKYSLIWDKSIAITMSQFAGWNFLGTSANLFRTQGVNILINLYWGTILNATQGLANQVNSAVQAFVDNFMTAINPQIIKKYAKDEKDKSIQMVETGSRLAFFLMFIFSFPIICETSFILNFWLDYYPDYTTIFVKLVLIYTLIEVFSKPIITLINATGKIRNYQIGISIILLLNFPLSYIAFELGGKPQSIYIIAIIISLIALFYRIHIMSKQCDYSIARFFINVMVRPLIVAILAYGLISFLPPILDAWIRFAITILISIILTTCIGMKKSEKKMIQKLVFKIVKYD